MIADLARIEDHVRIEYFLDPFHQAHIDRTDEILQIFDLAVADSVFAGDKSAEFGRLRLDLLHEIFDLSLEFIFFHLVVGVAAGVDVQVAVSGMAEALDLESVVLFQ